MQNNTGSDQENAAGGRDSAWAQRTSPFAPAVAFAIAGQPIAALLMWGVNEADIIRFKDLDLSQTAAFYVLFAVFILQIVALLIAIAQSGFSSMRIIAGAASLALSFGLSMILFVLLQCGLYGACL